MKLRRCTLTLVALTFTLSSHAEGADGVVTEGAGMSEAQREATAAAVEAYWTRERMEEAIPMPIPTKIVDPSADAGQDAAEVEVGPPGFAPGWTPGSGPQPSLDEVYEIVPGDPLYPVATGQSQPQHGTIPNNPLDGPYPPFQRWTWYGRYLTFPTAAVGRFFFTLNAVNYVCTASVINRNTLVTAGHCVSDGAGTFLTNGLFCPSYNAGGVNPTAGCWAATGATTSANWHFSGDPDFDYACVVTNITGTVVNDNVGDFTGWLGRSWNFASSQATFSFGYPAGAPFPGYHIITATSAEWYTYHFVAGDQHSKFIGNDMTGGSSGGPWILGLGHRNAEWADTDGSNATDPGNQWVNGVNSHKRCIVSCQSPPTAANGVFWQEMSSPQFLNTGGAQDSEDVFAACFASGGT